MQQPARATATSNTTESSRAATAKVNVQLPATIVSYDETTQLATVKIVPCFRRRDPAQGNAVVCYEPPDLPGVPVAFPGAGPFSVTWPLAAGDVGLLMSCDRSLDEWKSEGGTRTEPQDERRHSITDGVFVPGVRSPADPIPAAGIDSSAMVIQGAEIKLGSSAASDFVALAPATDTQFASLATAFSTWVPVPMDGGLSLKTLLTALIATGWPATVTATKVKAE